MLRHMVRLFVYFFFLSFIHSFFRSLFFTRLLGQGWPTSILSRAKTENFNILKTTHKFVAVKVRGTWYVCVHIHTYSITDTCY
jgi:hypothetical protein